MLQEAFFLKSFKDRDDLDDKLKEARITRDQFFSGNKKGNIYFEPDNTGAVLSYKAYYADENNELVPLMFPVDANGEPVAIGTEGSTDYWVGYSIEGTIGSLIEDDKQTRLIDIKINLRKNAKRQNAARLESELTERYATEGASALTDFVRQQDLTKLAQQYAPSEIVGDQ